MNFLKNQTEITNKKLQKSGMKSMKQTKTKTNFCGFWMYTLLIDGY